MPPTVAVPKLLTNPGFLWLAPIGTAEPTNTVTAGVFSDTIPAAWLALGATTEGSEFKYATTVEAIRVAELFDAVEYATTAREGSMAFNLANWTLSNYRRALNGGIAALTPTGASGAELTILEPPDPGSEVRAMLLWESTDSTVRILLRQCLQGGEITSSFKKAPDVAAIPCTFNMEAPATGQKPFAIWGAGLNRV